MAAHRTEVERSIDVELEPDEVWELLVDDDERSGWFGGPSRLEPVPGGAGEFTDPDGTRRRAVVDDVEPGRRLGWTWWPEEGDGAPSRVRIDLSPRPDGTRVVVTEALLVPTAPVALAAARPLLELEHRCVLRASARVLALA